MIKKKKRSIRWWKGYKAKRLNWFNRIVEKVLSMKNFKRKFKVRRLDRKRINY